MRRILQGVSVIMATFSDLYQSSGSPVSRAVLAVIHGVKYIINPELRAQQIVDVAQNSSVEFLKAFWSLSETPFMKKLPAWVCPKLEVREDIFIPSEPVTLIHTETNEYVVISPPSSHIAPAPIRCLLLSAVHREGQVVNKNGRKKNSKPRSRSLLFHCHGGGFISQTPESHEIYLRNWAHDLNVPILSVDYTLSPQAPFPRALEEVLLAYAWALNNADKLGWTGENICFAGDSAGGNILMGIVLKCISLKIRQPDAVLCAYTPLILDMMPSPSRLLCWIDPLLPLGFMISCLDAYAGAMQTDGDEYEEEPNHGASGTRSRKISSISEIFDSSVMFLKQYEWTEVEANEPSDVDLDVSAFGYEKETLNKPDKNDYIHDFLKECCSSIVNISSEDDEDHMEHDVFNLPNDIMFDIKEKFCAVAHSAINKLSQAFISTSLYQKVISPFIPLKIFPHQVLHSPFRSSSKSSILQKIRKLKIVSRNPFMSPLLASEEFLKQMPPIYFVVSILYYFCCWKESNVQNCVILNLILQCFIATRIKHFFTIHLPHILI
ncbi:hormone-sensitive lipase-like [Stegodyphus dumicola]|uniref:hormone-sensitive lipase-like n=1 Tax=Stegodyphus dumicola TaxID=202533 RepID=UPI0015AE65C6|nr:hormone-sensitive lipase-like [Stegodyphus dumicola]